MLTRALGPFPVTLLGLLIIVGCAYALFYVGLPRIDLVLLVIGAVGLGIAILATLATTLGSALIWFGYRSLESNDALEVECGYPVPTGFSLPRLWWIPLISLEWTWEQPKALVRNVARGNRIHEEVIASRRGVVGSIKRRVEIGDVFGISKMSFRLHERRRVRFVPSVGALKRVDVIRGMSGGDEISHPDGPQDGELYDLRHYNPGDPIRFVLWKVFARTRQLVVRSPERAISPVRQTVAFLVAGGGDEPAAGAARLAVNQGALGDDWVLGADACDRDAKRRDEALDVLAKSADCATRNAGQGLAGFLKRATPGATGRAVIFVPGRPGAWVDHVAGACAGRAERIEFIVCTDGIIAGRPKSFWGRLRVDKLGSEVPAGATEPCTVEEVAEVVGRLKGSGKRVVVVDRLAGRVYGDGHIGGMLRAQASRGAA